MDQKTQDSMLLLEHLPFETDRGIASRARIGLIVLATDYTIEHEWRRIMSGLPGVALYHSRILNDAQITPETLRAMEPRIAQSTDIMLPGADFKHQMAELVAKIKATPRQPGVDEIRIPSERAYRERERRRHEGIVLERKVVDALNAL